MEHSAAADRELERVVKGFANHRRIQVIRLLEQRPGLTLLEICKTLRIGIKAGSEHVRKLTLAGLVSKRHQDRWVHHNTTSRAKTVMAFLEALSR